MKNENAIMDRIKARIAYHANEHRHLSLIHISAPRVPCAAAISAKLNAAIP